jgi:uncharacterized protein YxjI
MPAPANVPATLSDGLHLTGRRNFLVQHLVLSLGHSYRVMDAQKNPLFTVQGDAGQNLAGNFLGSLAGGSDSYLGRLAARSVDMSYQLVDASGIAWGRLHKQGGANQSTFTLLDNAQRPWIVIQLNRGLIGGIQATAVFPDGRPMMSTSGNLIRHNFMIRDPTGQDLAKVHEQWIALRDTYNVDVLGSIDPLYPIIYSVAIDYEKEK